MRFPPPISLVLCCALASVLAAAEPAELADSGLPALPHAQVLPAGAAFHLRLNDLERSLASLDALIVSFLPDRALPPPLQELLAQPHPVLTFLGQQTVGVPIDQNLIARMTGLAADRPISLTIYPGDQGLDWILALPTADRQALTGLIVNLTRPRSFSAATVAGLPGWIVEGTNPDLPQRLVLLTSAETTYVCGSEELAAVLADGTNGHLADVPLFSALPADADLTFLISTQPVKPLIAMGAQQITRGHRRMIEGFRGSFLRGVPADQIAAMNLQLRLYTRLSSLEEAMSFAEALSGAAIETLLPALVQTLSGFDGCALGLTLRSDGFHAEGTIQAEGIDRSVGSPLPLKDIRAAIAGVPGDRLWFTAEGRHPPPSGQRLIADWLDRTIVKLGSVGITSPVLTALATYNRQCEPIPELLDDLPWLITTSCQQAPSTAKAETLQAWLLAMDQDAVPRPDLLIFPKQDPTHLAEAFAARAKVENSNAALLATLLTNSFGDHRFADETARFRRETRAGKPERLVYEKAWISRHGFFGYSQHELINRTIAYASVHGPFHLLQRVDGDGPCWLDEAMPAASPLPEAMVALLDRVPAQADRVTVVRLLPAIAAMLDVADGLEGSARAELDDYLERTKTAINDHLGDIDAINRALLAEPIPFLVSTLNVDRASKTLYLILPGGLRYPRPALVGVMRGLLANHLDKRDSLGGLVAWRTAGPRRISLHLDQDLRGLAWLVTSTGNAVWTQFFAAGDPERSLQAAVGHPADGQPIPAGELLLVNPLWPQPE